MEAIFTRIRFRILAIVLMAIIPAIGVILYSAAERKRQISAEIQNNAIRLSRFLANNLERDISEVRMFLMSTAGLLEAKGYSERNCPTILSRLVEDSSSVSVNLGIATPEGRVFCSASPFPAAASLEKLDWFEAIRANPAYTIGFDLGGVLDNEASINMAYPLSAAKKPRKDILFAVMDLDWLNDLAKEANLPDGSAISMTNRKGDAVARYPDPEKWVGKPYPRAHFLNEDADATGVKIAKGIDGVTRLYAYSTVKGKGDLVVYVGLRREAALEPANRALRNQLLALGVVSLLAILAAWFGADVFLIKQVRALIEATKKLAGGDLSTRSALSYDSGELGELARSFDQMAETLEWRNAQLQESESERANPLERMQEVIENMPEPVLVLDGSMKVLAANSLGNSLFGFESEEMAGLSFHDLCPDARLEPPESPSKDDADGFPSRRIGRRATRGKSRSGGSLELEIAFSASSQGKAAMVMVILHPAGASPGVPPSKGIT